MAITAQSSSSNREALESDGSPRNTLSSRLSESLGRDAYPGTPSLLPSPTFQGKAIELGLSDTAAPNEERTLQQQQELHQRDPVVKVVRVRAVDGTTGVARMLDVPFRASELAHAQKVMSVSFMGLFTGGLIAAKLTAPRRIPHTPLMPGAHELDKIVHQAATSKSARALIPKYGQTMMALHPAVRVPAILMGSMIGWFCGWRFAYDPARYPLSPERLGQIAAAAATPTGEQSPASTSQPPQQQQQQRALESTVGLEKSARADDEMPMRPPPASREAWKFDEREREREPPLHPASVAQAGVPKQSSWDTLRKRDGTSAVSNDGGGTAVARRMPQAATLPRNAGPRATTARVNSYGDEID